MNELAEQPVSFALCARHPNARALKDPKRILLDQHGLNWPAERIEYICDRCENESSALYSFEGFGENLNYFDLLKNSKFRN